MDESGVQTVMPEERALSDMTVDELKEEMARLRARRAVARERRRVSANPSEKGGEKPKRVRKGRAVIEDIDDDISFLMGDDDAAVEDLLS